MRKIENLVLEGGGVLGMAYAGAIEALHEKQLLSDVKRAAGTSAGALVATLVSLRYSAKEIKEIVNGTNFKKFEDHFDPLRVPFKYGLYRGNYLLKWIKNIIETKTGNKDATFRDLHLGGFRELKVFACDLTSTTIKEFSFQETPDVKVAESIRASMSIPLFFNAWKFPDGNPDDHIYVDGGTMYNYPINAFENSLTTLGFFFEVHTPKKVEELKYNHIFDYIELLFKALLDSQKVVFQRNKEEMAITVLIDTLGIAPTNFKITEDEKMKLFNSGKEATLEYIVKMPTVEELKSLQT